MIYKFERVKTKLIKGGKKSNSGRGSNGRICVRFKGGCNKRKYRNIDFTFKTIFPISQIISTEYDPNRTGFISRVKNLITNKHSFILMPHSGHKNQLIVSLKYGHYKPYDKSDKKRLIANFTRLIKLVYLLNLKNFNFLDQEFSDERFNLLLYLFIKKRFTSSVPLISNKGNVLPLDLINKGVSIYNVEARPNTKAVFARAAGVFATLMFHTKSATIICLSSGEYKVLNKGCFGVLGRVSNINLKQKKLRKASDSRRRNKRPHVRGVAMNPVDHPHGGGEGKTSGGRPSVTPWGMPTKGYKTSRRKKLYKSHIMKLVNSDKVW